MGWSDEDLEHRLRQMPELPVPAGLRDRIMLEASRSQPMARQRKRRLDWRSLSATGIGIAAACLLLIGGLTGSLGRLLSGPTPAVSQGTYNTGARVSFGLKQSPLQVSHVRIGTTSGYAKDGTVFAQLKNTSHTVIHPQDVVVVLGFQADAKGSDVFASDWVTVIGSPSHDIAPGQSVDYSFRPIGAPATKAGALTEHPLIRIFNASLVSVSAADRVLLTPAVGVTDVSASARSSWAAGESFQISATIQNNELKPMTVSSLEAIVWFGTQISWLQLNENRYVAAHLHPANAAQQVIQPGQKVRVYEVLTGPPGVKYDTVLPHFLIVAK